MKVSIRQSLLGYNTCPQPLTEATVLVSPFLLQIGKWCRCLHDDYDSCLDCKQRLLYIWIYSASTFNSYESLSSTVVWTGKTQIKKTAGRKVKVNKLIKTAGRKVKVNKTLALSPQLLHPPGLHLPGFCLLSSSLVQVTVKRGTSSLVRNKNWWTYCQVQHLGLFWRKYRCTCPGT